MEQFIQEQGIAMEVSPAPTNPHMDDPKWEADHWYCTFSLGDYGYAFSTYYSQGIGHRRAPRWNEAEGKPVKPKPADVLDCVASDAASLEDGMTFEDWADSIGYDTDSRKAEKTYNTIRNQAARLRTWLGADAFKELVENVERL